jgi:hypothetical protein
MVEAGSLGRGEATGSPLCWLVMLLDGLCGKCVELGGASPPFAKLPSRRSGGLAVPGMQVPRRRVRTPWGRPTRNGASWTARSLLGSTTTRPPAPCHVSVPGARRRPPGCRRPHGQCGPADLLGTSAGYPLRPAAGRPGATWPARTRLPPSLTGCCVTGT